MHLFGSSPSFPQADLLLCPRTYCPAVPCVRVRVRACAAHAPAVARYGGLAFDAVRVVETAGSFFPAPARSERGAATATTATTASQPAKFRSTGRGGGKGPGGVLPPRDHGVTKVI